MMTTFRQRVMDALASLVTHRPRSVIAVSLLLTVLSVGVTAGWMRFQSDRNALIDEHLPWNQRFIQWTRSFAGTYDLTVVIDLDKDNAGTVPPERTAQARRMADALGRALAQDRAHVAEVVWRVRTSDASPRLMRLLPRAEFEQAMAQLEQSGPVIQSPTPGQLIGRSVAQMQSAFTGSGAAAEGVEASAASGIADFTRLISAIDQTLRDTDHDQRPFDALLIAGMPGVEEWQYLATDNGKLMFLRVTPRRDSGALASLEQSIAAIRRVMGEIAPGFPELRAGLTGIEVIENDETQAVTRDSTITSVLAVVLIALLMVAAFHSVRTPLLAIAALLMGVAWTFGYLTLVIGHLQVLSVFFTVMLLGLGIAYGIHLASRYELVRHQYSDDAAGFEAAIRDTIQTMGPGIVTGAVTTAAAFATTMFTDFRGVAEMGHIAAVGVGLCLLSMFTVFPALLRIYKPMHRHIRPMEDRVLHFFEERWTSPFHRHPVATLVVTGVLCVLSVAAAAQMRFDYNLEELLPRDVESVDWQRRVVESGQSIYTGTSIVKDMAEARRRTAAFLALDTVSKVQGIGLLIVPDEDAKCAWVAQARNRMGAATVEAASRGEAEAADPMPQLMALMSLVRQASPMIPPALKPEMDRLTQAMQGALATLAGMDEATRQRQAQWLQQEYSRFRRWVAKAFDPSLLEPSDLPAELIRPYMNERGELALEVHPKVPEGPGVRSPLTPRFLPRFIADMESVDPRITGVVVQYFESGDLIRRSYIQAGVIALLLVFGLVWIDFGRLVDALVSLLPVTVGFLITFGLMWLIGMTINPANIIVLPLMFGIGIDAGVHVLHRYRMDPRTRPLGLTAGTGKAITITSYTTVIGFGTLLLARHRGIESLGFVLACGIAMTMLACWTVMPAWLELRSRRREAAGRA